MNHPIYKVVEREGKVFGLPFADFGFVVTLFLLIFIIGTVAGIFMHVSGLYYGIGLIIVMVVYFGLRYANKKKHPGYLFSYLSFKYLQPDEIEITEPIEKQEKSSLQIIERLME